MGTASVLALGIAVFFDPSNLVQRYAVAFAVEPPIIALLLLNVVMRSNQDGWVGSVLNNRFLVHIGRISYGMYLFHGLIGYTTERIVERRLGNFPIALIAECAAVIVFASASFRWFESPLRRWIAGVTGARRAVALAR
jgi:peptidoglycan/LPS O-acetylase OafA/YrhL